MLRPVAALVTLALGLGLWAWVGGIPNPPPQDMGLAYVWSSSMPLSELGIDEAREAARAAGVELEVIEAKELYSSAPGDDALRASLVAAGATVHYPALAILRAGRAVGNALLGYKRAEAYESLLTERLTPTDTGRRATSTGFMGDRHPTASPSVESAASSDPDPADEPGTLRTLQEAEVLWTLEVSPSPGAFFRHVPGTSYIAYDQRGDVLLHDLRTDRSFRGPGWIDFVPTPDGGLFVTPGRNSRGLEFYWAEEVFERGRAGRAHLVEPILVDPQMSDQYPSVGILATDARGRPSRYRVLVSWFSGLAFRDYRVEWGSNGPPRISPTSAKLVGCPGMDLSIPILAKDGSELAARDERTGTTKLFSMADDGSCREIHDLGRQTSKVGFSDDGRLVAFSSPDRSSGDGVRSTTWVLDRGTMEATAMPFSASAGLVIPEIVGADSLLIAVRDRPGARSSEFRLLCCAD